MTKLFSWLAASVATAVIAAPVAAQFQRRESSPPKLEHFYFDSWSFESENARGGEASYYIYLPKAHDHAASSTRRFPWILWCPGFGGPNDFQTRGGAETLDRLRGEGQIPELALIVFRPPGGRGRTTYMNGEAGGDIEDLLVQDLVAHAESRYRLSSERRGRAVMGVSAGGFGALKLSLRHPDVFGAVAAHSAAILPADPTELAGYSESMVSRFLRGGLKEQLGDPIDPEKWAEQMPMGLATRRTPEQLMGLHVYFDAGTEDDYGFFEPNQQLALTMKRAGHRFEFHPVEEGGHAWSSLKMRDNLARSLTFVGKSLSGKNPYEQVATFGGGCFWCTEAVLEQLDGVTAVTSGYMGGEVASPTYKQVCTGTTGHAEVVQVRFDTTVISYETLLEWFFRSHDPTTLNRQGYDVGTQYRSAIFFHDETQRRTALALINAIASNWPDPIVTEVTPLAPFWPAEGYHQDYYRNNSSQRYCRGVIAPKLRKLKLKTDYAK